MPQLRVTILAIACAVTGCCGLPSYQYGAAGGGCGACGPSACGPSSCGPASCGPASCGPCGCGPAKSGCQGCAAGGHPGLALHHKLHHKLAPQVPPGELVAIPKFHPVPTRPVFEPQLYYLPPQPHPTIPERFSTLPADEPQPMPAVRR